MALFAIVGVACGAVVALLGAEWGVIIAAGLGGAAAMFYCHFRVDVRMRLGAGGPWAAVL